MSGEYLEEKYDDSFFECIEHIRTSNISETSDKEEQLNSLNRIYRYALEFFNNCDEERKKKFCNFFLKNLSNPLNKWINDEFDECRNFTLDIYLLLEKNLDNTLLDNILFKNIKKEDNFIFICLNRLKEDDNQKIIEDKEEIKLKMLQFLYKIVKRHKSKDEGMPSHLLNFYIYFKELLISLSILIKEPFSHIKKLTCELLCELNFEKEQKEFNYIYRKLLKNLLSSLNIRQHDVRELILKCLKKLMCFDANREFLDSVLECIKKLCKNKSSNVLFEIINCIEVWYLNIKDLNNIEKAKLAYIMLLCINADVSTSFNQHCCNSLDVIAKFINNPYKKLNNALDEVDIYVSESEDFKEIKNNENIKNYKQKEEKIDKKYIYKEKIIPNKKYHNEKLENYDCFININKLFYILPPFNKISMDVHKFFGEIKRELFYEIMNNEKNSWSEGKDEFASIITIFLIFTYDDNFYFIKYILSFLNKSLALFKYIDYPSTPILIDDLFVLQHAHPKNTLEKYCYEYESFLYLRKFVFLIITCGYLMPIEIGLFEIAHILSGEHIKNIVTNFYKFQEISKEIVSHENNTNNYEYCKTNTKDDIFIKEYIFLNINYHKYKQKNFEKKRIHKKEDIIIEDHYYSNNALHENHVNSEKKENEHIDIENVEKRNEDFHIKEEKKEENKNINVIEENNKQKLSLYEKIDYEMCKLQEENLCDTENYSASIIYENRKIIFIILSQYLAGYYIRSDSELNKLEDEYINFILFLINENINYENVDSFPYILLTIKYLINIMKKECKNYSNILFHFLTILKSDNRFCSHSEINQLIEKVEYYCDKKKIHFYNEEYIDFIKNVENIIDFNDFKNFKYNLEFLNILLCNISEHVIMDYSSYLIKFLYVIITYELKPLIKSEFLLFINFFTSKNLFPSFFLMNSQDILQNILLPLCIWKSGLSEAEIRKGALICIKSLFVNNLFNNNIFQNNILIGNLICVLKSSIDDVWNNENREISISIIGEISKYISNNNLLIDLLDNLVKLLDDSNKSIRKSSATALYFLFQNKYLSLSDEKCEYIFPILLLHMDDNYSNFSKIIYLILLIAKNFNNEIFLKHARDSTENSLHAKLFKKDLMK